LDKSKQSPKYIFYKRTLYSLSIFLLVYLGCLQPFQTHLVKNILFQPLKTIIDGKEDIELIVIKDEMRIINKQIKYNQESKIEWPLNGSILLALTLFYISNNNKLLILLIKYQFMWIIIIPFAVLAIIQGNSIITILYNIHLNVYKIIFLTLGLLSIRQFYLSYNKQH